MVSVVIGSVLVAASAALGLPGAALGVANVGARDDSGFMMSGSYPLTTSTYALSSTRLGLHMGGQPMFTPHAVLGDTRMRVTSQSGKEIFVGIAPAWKVQAYLDGVGHSTFSRMMGGEPFLNDHRGAPPRMPPGEAGIWTAQSSGTGTQDVVWRPTSGDWTVVVMNADGSPGVSVDATAGAEVPALSWVVATLLVLAGLSLSAGVVLIVVPLRAVSRQRHQSV